MVEIKYFLNLNEYYLPIFILSIHFRQISFFKITKDIQSNNNNNIAGADPGGGGGGRTRRPPPPPPP